ncbi:MAG TPA: alpha/beta hydrolase [Terracidiphilus sp.]|nr:alpha/beta hydrolase [Terracidiphilus sp.]
MKLTKKTLWLGFALGAMALAAGISFWLHPVSYFNEFTYLRESLNGTESSSVTVEGHRMHYEAVGPAGGPVVVLVHGLGASAEDWLNLSPYLAKAGFRVYMPDLFGYGRSDKPADFSYSVRDEAGAVVGFMDALGLKQVDLGGWSMGGWIAQIIAAAHPERVRRLMLFDSAGLDERPAWDTNLFIPRTPAQLDQLEALLMPHPPRIPGFVAQDILRFSAQRAWIIRRALDTMLTGQDATDKLLPKLKMPVLLLWGGKDQITPLEQGQKMHMLVPQSELNVFNGCGHLAPEQCTAEMGPVVVKFLKQ